MPPLGRHYKQIWEDEDAGILVPGGRPSASGAGPLGLNAGIPLTPTLPQGSPGEIGSNGMVGGSSNQMIISAPAYPPDDATRFDPRQLRDEHLGNSDVARAGPLTERVLAALVPAKASSNHPREGSNQYMDQNGSGSGSGGMDRERERERERFREQRERESQGIKTDEHGQDMVEFEERIRRELKHLDVLGPEEVSSCIENAPHKSDRLTSSFRFSHSSIGIQELMMISQQPYVQFKELCIVR